MCGVTGIYAFNQIGRFNMINMAKATQTLIHRGPDNLMAFNDDFVGVGHTRLAVIDPRLEGNQPMWDHTGRYCIVYNGEIYNYKELRKELEEEINFNSKTDTEVLLYLFIKHGFDCLQQLNGFFVFAIYDTQSKQLFLARDEMGIKPLYYYCDQDKFIFASELNAVNEYGLQKEVDPNALLLYLQLNYVPAPLTMLSGVRKLLPGQCMTITPEGMEISSYVVSDGQERPVAMESTPDVLREQLSHAVESRLVADVPVGSFLSGGIDSSIIAALAAEKIDDLHTFSIGYKDNPYFDETEYARKVSSRIGSRHMVFSLSNRDLYDQVFNVLDHFDEPFGDSSAIAVYTLSSHVGQHIKVALSGDGADELFGGYNKYQAFYRTMHPGVAELLIGLFIPLWYFLPKSRNNKLTNRFRQLYRFSQGYFRNLPGRYWLWAGYAGKGKARRLMLSREFDGTSGEEVEARINTILQAKDLNAVLRADQALVLPDDMLKKIDLMSMAHGLEVRVPFLDKNIVNFANSLPSDKKIGKGYSKKILKEAFENLLPPEILNRNKMGFEVPMLGWLRRDLRSMIKYDLLSRKFIQDQGLFKYGEVAKLKRQLFSPNPGDSHARIWGLLVFQWWWKRYFG